MPGFVVWIGIVVVGALVALLVWRTSAFERLGARIAGDHRRAAVIAARAASPEAVARVAELASLLATREEQRLIRWTPARAANGARLALGASPAAWYLWLPEPSVLVRVPDALVANVDHEAQHDAVVRLRCRTRDADDALVTATDGTVVEEAEAPAATAATLLDGLVILDPLAKPTADPSVGAIDLAEPRPDDVHHDERRGAVAFGLAS